MLTRMIEWPRLVHRMHLTSSQQATHRIRLQPTTHTTHRLKKEHLDITHSYDNAVHLYITFLSHTHEALIKFYQICTKHLLGVEQCLWIVMMDYIIGNIICVGVCSLPRVSFQLDILTIEKKRHAQKREDLPCRISFIWPVWRCGDAPMKAGSDNICLKLMCNLNSRYTILFICTKMPNHRTFFLVSFVFRVLVSPSSSIGWCTALIGTPFHQT